jgi:uncharacterized protein
MSGEPLRIPVRVQPRASRDRVVGRHGESVKVQVTAPPVDGAANAAVVNLLAEWLDVPRRCLSIARGQTGRDKLVEVDLDDAAERRRVEDLLGGLARHSG